MREQGRAWLAQGELPMCELAGLMLWASVHGRLLRRGGGQATILKLSPLNVQIKAEVEAALVRIASTVMVDKAAEVLAYGLYRLFITRRRTVQPVAALRVVENSAT